MSRQIQGVYFASERTLLAWVRTGISLVGLGLVVSRFGIFLRVIHPQAAPTQSMFTSSEIGVLLVLLGMVMILGSSWQHAHFVRGLPAVDRPKNYWCGFSLVISASAGLASLVLAIYLVMT